MNVDVKIKYSDTGNKLVFSELLLIYMSLYSSQVKGAIAQLVGDQFDRLEIVKIQRLRRRDRTRFGIVGVNIRFYIILKSKPSSSVITKVSTLSSIQGQLPLKVAQAGSMF